MSLRRPMACLLGALAAFLTIPADTEGQPRREADPPAAHRAEARPLKARRGTHPDGRGWDREAPRPAASAQMSVRRLAVSQQRRVVQWHRAAWRLARVL